MFSLLIICVIFVTSFCVELEFINNEPTNVWIAIEGNAGQNHLNHGGFILNSSQSISIIADETWSGRIWPRSHCSNNICETGDCGVGLQCNGHSGIPPFAFIDLTLKGWYGLDYYEVSLIHGFNLKLAIQPINGKTDSYNKYSCQIASCKNSLLNLCPKELVDVDRNENIIACKSACVAFNTDEYCCRGQYSTPENCRSSKWDTDYASVFKENCPNATSYIYDQGRRNFTCKAEKYVISVG